MKNLEAWIEPSPYIIPLGEMGDRMPAELAFTTKQRQWWLRVYTNGQGKPQCAFPMYDEERGFYRCGVTGEKNLEIHHITPTGWIRIQKPWSDPNAIDFEEGHLGIALCDYHHDRIIHPDIGAAFDNYKKDKGIFKRTIERHNELAREGIIFWDNDYDEFLIETAEAAVRSYCQLHPNDLYPDDPSWKKKPRPKKTSWFDEI